jgi:hypothetical protein
MRLARFTLCLALGCSSLGCSKTPVEVCEAMIKVAASSKKAWSDKQRLDCIKDLSDLRKETQPGYDCIADCWSSARGAEDAIGLCVDGCYDVDPKLREKRDAQKAAEDEARLADIVDWTRRPTRVVSGQLRDPERRSYAFKLSLPSGFEADKGETRDFMRSYVLRPIEGGAGPTVQVALARSADVEMAKRQAAELRQTVVSAQPGASGFTLATKTDGALEVRVLRDVGISMECRATFYHDRAAALEAALLPWLTAVCESLQTGAE